jgi:hypothetical protein
MAGNQPTIAVYLTRDELEVLSLALERWTLLAAVNMPTAESTKLFPAAGRARNQLAGAIHEMKAPQ